LRRSSGLPVFCCLLTYLLVYTPLKRITSLSTLVGAVPGALPAVAGWTASAGRTEPGAWALFWILFVWQIPHFLALAWMYREDYRRGGFKMLTLGDADGRRTGRQAFVYALALIPISLLPTLLGVTGPVYFIGAFVLGITLLAIVVQVVLQSGLRDARRVFFASVLYLPALLVLMILDAAVR
jgi:protoheme IX farnesyltransferase